MADQADPLDSLFAAAVELPTAEQRAEYLHRACSGDVDLRRKVEGLVDAHFRAGAFLESPVAAVAATALLPPIGERAGDQIGSYKLLEQIGEGGMGLVFMAEQSQPLRRRVALKIIKPGLDTRSVIARFEAERQALALMDHPNIARVFDAGATDTGRPYFVMELVAGVPITEFCDSQKLPHGKRLALFIDVCRAVQHAHQKGVIHRDLKPSNVLVTLHDDRAVPKVIDFGVAKAIGEQLTEKTLFIHYGQMIGTPTYMSPEQAQLSGLDVDTRSDVYSLGVLLYELATGTTPFEEQSLKQAGFDEMRRIIREDDPPRPSERVSTLKGDLLSTVADRRQVDPRKLGQSLRGELDWIVMKCLEKDRNRRYDSVGSLQRDVDRYLHDEPVQACPPSAAYRFRKFSRRNKTLLTAGSAIAATLVIGLGLSTWMYFREHTARQVARANEYFTEAIAQLRAGDVAGYREKCKALVDVPVADLDDDTKLRQIHVWALAPNALEDSSLPATRAEALAADNSIEQPHIVLYVLGAALYRDGQYDRAADTLENSIAVYPSDAPIEVATIHFQRLLLAMSRWQQGKQDEARRLLA
jgi:serine/threonine protein kinase